ncbi:Tat pathway signal protein [Streptomyces sp. TRM72054]|uniref:golvesin C-terminal-like domain-containing protein n=1 Tax=Streptomyces sp. TRM72054 TaxID=2870562 RepID=UPI001C8CA32D|nr:Tat pathway signal protein [Streptomyces sp. TRM72054]MBX9394252.1 Tat pathway signal protein [Streptomyces sp. TRM72054]
MLRIPVILAGAVALVIPLSTQAYASQPKPPKNSAQAQAGSSQKSEQTPTSSAIPTAKRDTILGKGWKTSADRAVTAAADSDGLHLLVADSKTGYSWKTAAVLSEPQLPADTWIGNQCVMDDHHAAVAYAPRSFTNKPDLMMGGAFTAIVNLDDGSVTKLALTASLAYFDPTCNPATRTAVFTALRDTKTRLVTVNAKGTTVADTTAKGEITSAVPTSDGAIAAAGNRLIHVDRKGRTTKLAATKHAPYAIRVTGDGTVVYLDRTGNTDAEVQTYAHGRKTTVASGKLTAMNLRQGTDGTVYLIGKADHGKGFTAGGIKPLDVSPDADVSTRGRLAVDPVVSPAVHAGVENIKNAGKGFASSRTKEPAPEQIPGRISHALRITGTVPGTGMHTKQQAAEPGTTAGGTPSPVLTGSTEPQLTTMSLMTTATSDSRANDPVDTDRWCSVPRNDVDTQALQPTPNQVEWAVDMAIRGELRSGYLTQGGWRSQTGISTIDPQGMFPPPQLNTGGRIPAQVELGILAQESNLWQAESGAIPGQMGSPLAAVDGFYGHQTGGSLADYWTIHWDESDCGYGVGQVTDGMRMAGHEKDGETALAPQEQRAIAIDYATNIAASLYILADKWNEVHETDQTVTVNNDDPAKPENWFTAVWNYNLGFNKKADETTNGNWGLGWYNNPANPVYPPTRLAFMDTDLDPNANQDAAHPQNWPYEEKVMGWAAWSIDTGHSYATSGRQDWPGESGFSSAGFYPAWWNTTAERSAIKPPLDTFCNAANNCDASNPPDCPDAGCYTQYWWNASNATWKDDCATTCGHEHIKYQTLINEPGRGYRLQYGTPVCSGAPSGSLVVESVPAGTNTWSDCGTTTTDGSFQFTFYPDPNATGPGLGQYDAKADLHQIGGGYQGHFWYAHTRDYAHLGGTSGRMTVLGTWKLNGPVTEKQAMVYVHIPDTGAQTHNAVYKINTAWGEAKVRLDQYANEANKWVSLGAYRFNDNTPQVSLSNSNGTGSAEQDIAWDAVAFVPGDYGISSDRPVDLTLPDPNESSPNPDLLDQPVSDEATAPLNEDASNPAQDGSVVPHVSSHGVAPWCDDGKVMARATRTIECETRVVPFYLRMDGQVQATAWFQFQRTIELTGTNSFTEHLSVAGQDIPPDFAMIQLAVNQHLCESPCTPVEASMSAWQGSPTWTAGDTHEASLTSSYTWDTSTSGQTYFFHPDVKIDGDEYPSDDSLQYQTTGYQWSKSSSRATDLDTVRCDTVVTVGGGCVFPDYAPTYTFNGAKYPQAAAHAWLIQTFSPKHPGSKATGQPLYYLSDTSQRDKNRSRMCPSSWAANNGDLSALDGPDDEILNCDEFAFGASYNSGGMNTGEGGLNPAVPDDSTTGVPNGRACIQTYATQIDSTMHLYNLSGTVPTWTEVCGRSAISDRDNQDSMSPFGGFITKMRLMGKDAYWLDTAVSGDCGTPNPNSTSVKCTLTATN